MFCTWSANRHANEFRRCLGPELFDDVGAVDLDGTKADAETLRDDHAVVAIDGSKFKAVKGDGADGSGRTRPASLADRSRPPFDGD